MVRRYNKHQEALIGDPNHSSVKNDDLVKNSLKEIEMRKKSVCNMWIIIMTIFTVEMYQTLYSIILAVWGNDNCYV